MKRHVLRFLAFVLLVPLLTGCIAYETTTKINSDGSGTNEMTIGFTRALIEFLGEGEDPFADITEPTEEEINGWTTYVEPWENDMYKGIRMTLPFADLAMLEEQLNVLLGPGSDEGMFGEFTVRQDGNMVAISSNLTQEGLKEEDIEPEMMFLLEGFKVTWTVEMPELGGYSEEQIATRDGNRVTWDFPLSEETQTYNIEVYGSLGEDVAVMPTPMPTEEPTPMPTEEPTPMPTEVVQPDDAYCFAEVPYCISGRIREFWQEHGGMTVFGLPITEQYEMYIEDKAYQVQEFERNRMELHPENMRPYDVLLGRLGVEMLEQQGRNWWSFPTGMEQAGCVYFEETRHSVCDNFLNTWQSYGLEVDGKPGLGVQDSLALFGYPISEPMQETLSDGNVYTVQYFERVRIEHHPENPMPHNMLFGLLGVEVK